MSYQYNNQQRQYSYAPPPPSYGGAPPPPPHLQQQQQWQYQQASSQQSRRQTAPPSAGVDPMLYHWFQAIDTDKSGTLTTEELQRALLNGDWSPFNMETVRLMMNLFDTDNDGTITFKEFTGLWKYIEDWKRCFQTFDADGSGTIDFNELKTALKTFGYNLSDSFIDLLIKKYDKYGKGNVTFDNFVQSCVTIKTLTDAFRRFDTDNDGWIMISYEEFLRLVVNNR